MEMLVFVDNNVGLMKESSDPKLFHEGVNRKCYFSQMLDSIRFSLLGRANYPHQLFMTTGCHAITLVTHGQGAKTTTHAKKEQYVKDFVWIIEKLLRIHDQLDEQLHAGFYFYILTGP